MENPMNYSPFVPDTDDVLGVEIPSKEPAVSVNVENRVRTQAVGNKAGSTRTVTFGGVAAPLNLPLQLLKADHRRAKAVVIGTGAFAFAFQNAAASGPDQSRMCAWPANVPLTVNSQTDFWVVVATGTPSVSFYTEDWATGD